MAATAVTLCLPLPVNQLPFSICRLAIIKGCPAANAVYLPCLPFPSPLIPRISDAQFLSLQNPGLGTWHAPLRPSTKAFSSDLRARMQIQFQNRWESVQLTPTLIHDDDCGIYTPKTALIIYYKHFPWLLCKAKKILGSKKFALELWKYEIS